MLAGLEALHSQGFNGCGVQDVTDAAKVPTRSFYNHFESTEALGAAALDRYRQIPQRAARELSEESVPPIERLRSYF